MAIKTFIVDSFTDLPFKGNPAGVCLVEETLDIETMQSIAAELNLSETAFLLKNDSNSYSIRYFTPTVEIDFCGHATLAAAKIILDQFDQENVCFVTRKELQLSACLEGKFIKMTFPLYDTIDYEANHQLYAAFGIKHPLCNKFSKDLDMLLVEVKDKQALLDLKPNFEKAIESSDTIKEVVITTKSEDPAYDFYSRCFCPWIGINEDPVTGAAHAVLAKYWSSRLNKDELSAFQISKRGGFLKLNIINDTTLEVRSQAVIVFEGNFQV